MAHATIVSCYYELPNAKHPSENYKQWITNFLQSVDSPIVMFSDGKAADFILDIRIKANLQDKFYLIRKPFNELKFSGETWDNIWNAHVHMSNFSYIHNKELFKVWANKSFFVQEAIEKNPFQTEFFVWCDAGCWRDERIASICGSDWPVVDKITPKKLHILAIHSVFPFFKQIISQPTWSHEELVQKLKTDNEVVVGGTILLGDREAWATWIPAFEVTLLFFIKNNKFAGDDQAILATTALWLHIANKINAPIFYKAPIEGGFFMGGGDLWFAFQQHFSVYNFKLDTY
jgi:hypothetical protein